MFYIFISTIEDSFTNRFWKAFGYAWLERMIKSKNQTIEVAKALSLLESSLLVLKGAGFQELVYQDFYDVLASLIRQILIAEPGGSVLTTPVLLEAFQDPEGMWQGIFARL